MIGSPAWNTPRSHNLSFASVPNPSTPVSHVKEQHIAYHSSTPCALLNSSNVAKSSGPPTQGLLYSASTPTTSFNVSEMGPISKITQDKEDANFSSILSPNKLFSANNTTYLSPAQIDPFFTQGEALKNGEQLDESWVTVFGFPSASSSYILQQFSQYGNITDHKISLSGNWMHIKYQSKLQAKKALSKNGKIFSGNIMIGVKPCIEMDLMESTKENLEDTSLLKTQDSFLNSSSIEPSKPSLKNIRPLTQAYQSPTIQSQALQQKSGNIVSKALEYLWKS
ncbi:nucleoporin NUP35-like isoform X2 [Uloborus diversus]|uniref:nucleoporin NUP35-like isoform X2 n=1 Tax=Uloborus diversus TaxID=327109 RepID=UPI0024092DB1|nr:nucleoporin NUP35-like isoform X2 [Uloborus diversus]XP_054723205.1 nucleoporin NUP35-like isoform X2 [Uloborus diversus]